MTQKDYPVVSIIIPTYNRENIVSRAIHSILAQTYQNFEIIVVDDASTDNTESVISGFTDPRIQYVRQLQNGGAGVARNVGINVAQGQYIAFLDSDDEWFPEKLAKQVEQFQQSDPQVGVLYTWWIMTNERNGKERLKSPQYQGEIYQSLLYANVVGTPSVVMVKRECLLHVNGFDNEISQVVEDWDLWLRLAQHYKFDFVPEPLCRWWDGIDKTKLTINSKVVVKGYKAILKKYPEMASLPRSWRETGSESSQTKAQHLFNLGRRLVCMGGVASDSEAVEFGKNYLSAAFWADPLNFNLLAHYIASFLSADKYRKFVHNQSQLLRLASQMRNNLLQSTVNHP
jgi:glycosyltransferase involved in cell wall biosynthesis